MKRISPGAALSILSIVIMTAGCDNNPASPSTNAATMLRATIAAASAVPAVTGAEAAGTGTVTLTLNATKDADGIITGGTIDYAITLNGYPAGTVVTAANIRVGGAAANGVIVQDTGLAARGGATLATGSGTIAVSGVPVTGPVANALVANPVAYYFNVQSQLNPTTAARGQLVLP
jgi:hypothetical protein